MLAAALLVAERGLHAAREGATEGESQEGLEAVEGRARVLREGMDFAWLYDGEAGLMHTPATTWKRERWRQRGMGCSRRGRCWRDSWR